MLVDALLERKGSDIMLIDIHEQSVFADYFLLCTGESEPQLKALTENVLLTAKKNNGSLPQGVEGQAADGWVLVDFGDVAVHLFAPEQREYYDLESLWHDGRVVVRLQ